jgi:hypothetical protein
VVPATRKATGNFERKTMSQIKGTEPSVSSTHTATVLYEDGSAENLPVEEESGPALHPLAEPSAFSTVVQIVNGIVTPNLRVLLASVLGAIDASIPNKDQNKAVKHIVRTQFDEAYFDILRRSYPDSNFVSGPEYSVTPESNRSKAMAEGFLKQG